MPYLGTPPQSGFISQEANQYFTGLTQNYIDLNQSISSLSSVIILVNGIVQENSTMSLTSSTRITLGDTLVSADKVTCIYVAKISSTQAPATSSVTNDMLAGSIANDKLAGSIANSKLANSSITLNGSAVSLGGSATTPSGGLVKLSTVSTNNSNVANFTFDEVFSSTYDQYKIIGFISPTTDSVVGRFKFRTGGASGTDYSSNQYVWTHFGHRVDSSHAVGSDIGGYASESYGAISSHSVRETPNGSFQAIDMNVFDPLRNLMSRQTWHGTVNYQNASSSRHFVGTFGGRMNDNVDATGIKFYFSSGNINYGIITIFGVVK